MTFERLSERHLSLIDAFSCVESDEALAKYPSKIKRRVKQHSKEMDRFLKEEAFNEQEMGLSVTYLALDDSGNIIGYVSLCNDAINLEIQEREDAGIEYGSAPALKIARLAVSSPATGQGIGKTLIAFSAYQAQEIRKHSGIFFLTLDCYEHRVAFYESVGFVRNLIQPILLAYDSPISMRLSLNKYLESCT